jgi:AcrR family transcriptional regulator
MTALPEHLQSAPAGRHRLPREVMAEHQRERVLDAAIPVFAKRGYRSTTVNHIVAAAKIGVGSFYALFEGKEDCFLGTYAQIVDGARERIADRVLPGAPWPEQVFAGLSALLEMVAAEPLEARIALIEVQTAGPVALARYTEVIDSAVEWLRQGRELNPPVSDLPPTFEEAAVGGVTWLLQQCLLTSDRQPIETLLPETAQMILEPFVGEAELSRLSSQIGTASQTG